MKEKLIRFMAGRYGFDSLGKATIIAALAAVVLASLFDVPVLSWLAWALIIYAYFRMFSPSFPLFHGEGRLPVGALFGD